MFDATPWIQIARLLQAGNGKVMEYLWKIIDPANPRTLASNCEPDEATAVAAAQQRAAELGLGELRVERGHDGIWLPGRAWAM
jgi:hypothetical protein